MIHVYEENGRLALREQSDIDAVYEFLKGYTKRQVCSILKCAFNEGKTWHELTNKQGEKLMICFPQIKVTF